MLQIRERPPLRLSVNVETPAGATTRWGSDESSPENQPQSLTFSTTMPGGFESFSLTLQRQPRRAWWDLEELSRITVGGAGGQIAWQGRLEQLPDTGGSQSQISPAGSGYQNALQDDNSAAMIYVDQSLGSWQGPDTNRQIADLNHGYSPTGGNVATDASGNPALALTGTGSWAEGALPSVEMWYDSGPTGGISELFYYGTYGAWADGAPVWPTFGLSTDDTLTSADTTPGAGSVPNTAGGGVVPAEVLQATTLTRRYALAMIQCGTFGSGGGTDNQNYSLFLENLAVIGNHGLATQGTWPANIGYLASQVVEHAIRTWASEIGYTIGPNGSIQASSFVIPQLTFMTPTTAAAIIQQVVQYELLDWAVWEGPLFWLNPLGTSAKTRHWRCRIGDCQLQETGPDVTRVLNGVVVQFSNVDGTNGTVGPPGSGALTTDPALLDFDPQNPANQAGIAKYGILQMGTTTPAAAVQVGAQYLQAQTQLDTSGQASLVGHVQDDRGVWWPAWMVRSGDTLTIVDASDTSARRITATSYTDVDKTNAVSLGAPPDSTAALLQRLSAVVQPFGLS